jgi:hypothetical protein
VVVAIAVAIVIAIAIAVAIVVAIAVAVAIAHLSCLLCTNFFHVASGTSRVCSISTRGLGRPLAPQN